MKNIIKKNNGELITFFSTIIFLIIIFKIVGIFDHTILISDLKSEFYPFLKQVRRLLTGQIGLYNFNMGMGDSFLGTLYFYMSSPFNILTLFIKDINLLSIILIILKSAFSSIFCYKYLKYQFKEEKIYYLIVFSLLYALSSFYLAYNMHIEFSDIYMLFPLLLLGIDKKIKENKNLPYILSLMFIIFCNYYFAYMICIFSFIYFNYKVLLSKNSFKELLKKNLDFILISFLSCLAMSFVLLPVATEITSYSRQNGALFGGEKISLLFNLYNVVNHYILGDLSNINILNKSSFYVYTSIIVIPLIYFYYVNKDISKREKLLTSVIFFLLLISIGCNYVNYMWHGFVPTNYINGRFTFMFILFILMISIKSIYNIKEYKLFHYIIAFLLVLIPIVIYCIKMYPHKLDIINIGKVVLVLVFIISLNLVPSSKKVNILIIILLVLELGLNSYLNLNKFKYNLLSTNNSYEKVINYIKKSDDSKYYRIEDNAPTIANYSILYNYYGIDYFMSTIKKDLFNFFANLNVGNHGTTKNVVSYDGSYNLISSLLNIKYYVEFKNIENDSYTKIKDINKYKVYKNDNSLELGYIVNQDLISIDAKDNGLDYINNIYKGMTGNTNNTVERVKIENKDKNLYSFNNKKKNDFYVLVDLKEWKSEYQSLKVSLNDEELKNTNNTYLFKVKNNYELDSNINIKVQGNDIMLKDILGVYVYYYNDDVYRENIDILKQNQLKVTEVKKNGLVGNIETNKDGILFTSIPYSNDLDIYVDGKKQDKIKLLDAFIGTKLDKGKHKIVIKYRPKVLYISFIPSILSLVGIIIYLKKKV